MAITAVDLRTFTPTASEILRAAWKPPCLDYSLEYLAWQFGFPSDLAPVALAAYQHDQPVAFVAATGRMTNAGQVYMSSFMSILPGTPSSIAIGIIRQQSRLLKASGAPTVIFAQKESVGEQLLAVGETVGLRCYPLGEYRIHASASNLRSGNATAERVSAREWSGTANSLQNNELLSMSFDERALHHLEADPFGREFLISRRNGRPDGVAMLSETRSLTATGKQSTPTLHYVRLRDDDPDLLLALLDYARGRGPVVNVPNVTRIPVATRKAAGLRATPSIFTGHVSTASSPPEFAATEFEIV